MDIGQALSYTTIAMRKLGYKQVEIEEVTNTMLEQIKNYPGNAAEEYADEIIYTDHNSN